MKCTNLIFLFCLVFNVSFGQGIISDIMSVETVSLDYSELNAKIVAKYKATLEEEKTSLQNDLAALDNEYQEDVTKFVADFSQKLKEGDQKIVTKTKQITVSRVNSLTMTHRTVKKNRVQDFQNKMQIAVRSLPYAMRENAENEVQNLVDLHRQTLEKDYIAHLETINAFEEQIHLVIKEGAYEPVN